MTGAENYKRAEELIERADEVMDADYGWMASMSTSERLERRAADLAAAQVHATLALAAATAMAARLNDTLSGWVVGMDTPDQKAWDKVAGEGR